MIAFSCTQVVVTYAIGTAVALAAFWACPNQPTAQWLAVATVGFFLYGPQMLIGLCGAEVVSPSAVGASQGFLGWISYLGQYVLSMQGYCKPLAGLDCCTELLWCLKTWWTLCTGTHSIGSCSAP